MAEDERNDRARLVLAWLVAGVVVVGGAVGVGSVVTHGDAPLTASGDAPPSPSGEPTSTPSGDDAADSSEPAGDEGTTSWQPAPWDGARLEEGRLTLYFTGSAPLEPGDPCTREYEAVVEPTEDSMVVTLRGRSPAPSSSDQGCTLEGHERSVTVDLPQPLRGRTVVDGASDEPKTISRAARLLTPSWLPAGYRSFRDRVDSDTDSYVDRQEWARKDDAGTQVIVAQRGETVEKLGTPEGHERVVLDRPTIRGRPAAVWKHEGFDDLICVSWNEGSTGHQVCSSGDAGDLLPIDKLVRVADQLREPDGS